LKIGSPPKSQRPPVFPQKKLTYADILQMHHSTLNQGIPEEEQFSPSDFVHQYEPESRFVRLNKQG